MPNLHDCVPGSFSWENNGPNLGGFGGWGLRLGPGLSGGRTGLNLLAILISSTIQKLSVLLDDIGLQRSNVSPCSVTSKAYGQICELLTSRIRFQFDQD